MSPAGRIGGAVAGVVHALAAVVLGLLVLALLGGAGLAWQLSQGPVQVGWLARRIEAAANGADGPTRLQIGAAWLAWDGFSMGAGRPLEVRLDGVRAVDAQGAAVAEVGKAEVALSVRGLLAGQLVPAALEIRGARLRVLRAADGSVRLDVGSLAEPNAPSDAPADAATPLPQLLADLAGPRGGDPVVGGMHLRELRRILVRDVQLEIVDRQLGTTWRVPAAEIDLRRPEGGGLSGTAGVLLALGEVAAQLDARATLAEGGASRVEASLSPVAPAALARAAPALAGLAALDAPLALAGTLELSPALAPLRATLRATVDAGRIQVAGSAVELQSAGVELAAAWNGPALGEVRVTGARAVLPLPGATPTTVTATGVARLGESGVAVDLAGGVDQIAFAELGRLWPQGLARNARTWIVANITSGTMRAGRVALSLAGASDLSDLKLTAIDGKLQGEDVTIHWLRPVPPIERVQAVLSVTDPGAISIVASSGRQGPLTLRGGTVRISGLESGDEALAIEIEVAGTVPDTLALLRHPRLKLLDRQKLTLRNPAGTVEGHIALQFPLVQDLDADQIDVRATARTAGLRLEGIAAGRDLERGAMQLKVTQDGLKATGSATVGTIPAQLAVELDFQLGPPSQVVQRIVATGRATAQQLGAADLDVDWVMQRGHLGLNGTYTARRDGQAELRVKADLRDAGLEGLGWRKAPGVAGQASARLAIRGERLAAIEEIRAEAPGLRIEGRSDTPSGKPSLLLLDRIELGRTRAAGEVRLAARPGEPIRAVVSGPVLDISALLARKGKQGKQDDEPGAPWAADVVFDRVLLGADGEGLVGVAASARSDGGRITSATIESGGPERLRASVVPHGRDRQVSVRAADAGALMRVFDVTDKLVGGQLVLTARYDDSRRGSPLSGTAELSDFGVKEAQMVGKVLQGITLYGLVDALSGPGLVFDKMRAPFRYEGDVLSFEDTRAFSASLGVTAKGRLNLARKTVDVEGTIVPAYILNTALGRLPLVGRLFSPERGGGVLSVAYTVRGKADDPTVTVNPLSALTPGFLRGLFKIFD